MPYTLQQLSDMEEIKVLKHRYFRAIDTGDFAALPALFTADVACTYNGGTYKVSLKGREAMVEFRAHRDRYSAAIRASERAAVLAEVEAWARDGAEYKRNVGADEGAAALETLLLFIARIRNGGGRDV